MTASTTTSRRSDHPRSKPEWIQHESQPVRVYGTSVNVKSVNQLRIVSEPAKATTTRDRMGSVATKPLISVIVVSFLVEVSKSYIKAKGGLTSRQIQQVMSRYLLVREDKHCQDR